MSSNIRPSPAIVVSADAQIGDVVRTMRDHEVGSVLVVREVKPHDLVGIFTERDLLHKIDEIQHGGYWDKGIASVMTKPVISLSVYELGKAAEIMTQHHIRHLPVVYVDEKDQSHIAGVISMRDLFIFYHGLGITRTFERELGFQPKIGIACKDDVGSEMLRTILSQHGKADIIEADLDHLLSDFEEFIDKNKPNILVVDLDFVAPARWARFLRLLNHHPLAPACILLFTPRLQEEKNAKILAHLSDAEKLTAFAKPINVLGLVQKVEIALRPTEF